MNIVVASGKGGTGKTTISTNLAYIAAQHGMEVLYADCDVEEPNGHIFLNPAIHNSAYVSIPIPEVDPTLCNLCGQCESICQFNAITLVGEDVLIFPDLCHSCGGCFLVCPTYAIKENFHAIGQIRFGDSQGIQFIDGSLHIGKVRCTPIIEKIKTFIDKKQFSLLDAPPGTACPLVETIRDCDYAILVTEPTPFGLNDLQLAVETLRVFDIPFGVIINRSLHEFSNVHQYCMLQHIEILGDIPYDQTIAEYYSEGKLAVPENMEYYTLFDHLFETIINRCSNLNKTKDQQTFEIGQRSA